MEQKEVVIDRQIIKAFISYNRAYDAVQAKDEALVNEGNFSELGDTLELLAFDELTRAFPEAKNTTELTHAIVFDILDAEPLKALPAEELAIEFLNYFAGEFENRKNG